MLTCVHFLLASCMLYSEGSKKVSSPVLWSCLVHPGESQREKGNSWPEPAKPKVIKSAFRIHHRHALVWPQHFSYDKFYDCADLGISPNRVSGVLFLVGGSPAALKVYLVKVRVKGSPSVSLPCGALREIRLLKMESMLLTRLLLPDPTPPQSRTLKAGRPLGALKLARVSCNLRLSCKGI